MKKTIEDVLPDSEFDLEPEVQKEKGYKRFIMVDNLPQVPESKHEKLLAVVRKIYSQVAPPVHIEMPRGESGEKSPGFAFIEFENEEDARNAIEQTHGYPLDKSHQFVVNSFEMFEELDTVPDEFVAPEIPEFVPRENEAWWLLDEKQRDQYVLRYADETEVMWNQHKFGTTPATVTKQKNWTDSYVMWSPHGSYLATFHSQGVKLWSGDSWKCVGKFPHPGVKLLAFSPKEKYLVTFSNKLMETETPKNPQSVIVWDTQKGRKMRTFVGGNWPVFQWSANEKYLARMGKDVISVYESATMNMMNKKSLRLPGVQAFCWSPTDDIISCVFPESGNAPARVRLIDVPNRKPIRSQNLFRVMDVNMHWQSNGDYLCVKVDRHSKSGKRSGSVFVLFRAKEKGVPVETMEIEKEMLIAFAWEPKGHRFAVVHSESSARTNVSFYSMINPKTGAKTLTKLGTLDKKQVNRLFWSPGLTGHILLAGIGSGFNGTLEFFDVESMSTIRADQHNMLTDVLWDPSGQFVATFVSYWRHQVENGYVLWTFQGRRLFRATKDKFYQLLWRPRPPSLLPPQKKKEVEKSLKTYALRYIEEENEEKRKALAAFLKKRADKSAHFHNLREQRQKELQAEAEEDGREEPVETQFVLVEEEVEEVVEQTVEILKD